MICRAGTFNGHTEDNWTGENWSGDVQFSASKYWVPDHNDPADDALQQLVEVVAQATDQDQPLRVLGAGWAFEDIAKSDGWVVSLHELDHELDYVVGNGGVGLTDSWRNELADPMGRRLFHVEAGIRIATLSERLEAKGLAMPTLGGANGQALAGVISTSTHGGDWQQPPFPDVIRALHLVTHGGQEKWIERASSPLTTDDRLALPCADTEVIRDDEIFDAAIVTCGRFGVIYSFVLEVVPSFRVVEAVTKPTRSEVLQALRDGVTNQTLFQPLFDLLAPTAPPAGLDDAMGEPYFFQILFNSQNPNDLWVHRRWVTTNADDLPAPTNTVTGEVSDDVTAVAVLAAADAALTSAAIQAVLLPIVGTAIAAYITAVQIEMNAAIASRPFSLGSVVAETLNALWKVRLGAVVPGLNSMVIGSRFDDAMKHGRRGPHYLMTSGSRADSDNISYRAASIELVFDATTTDYLDFLDLALGAAPSFHQAGYVSLRPSLASRGYLSMHGVQGSHAVSIEIASLQGLDGNPEWMRFVHRLAVDRNGRPHWGQYNKLDALDVSMMYGDALNKWREALLRVSGTSTLFSNGYCRTRGLEPTAVVREVTHVRKNGRGTITHVCNPGATWSPAAVRQALREIESGTIQYFVKAADRLVPIRVVGGRYLRSAPDDTTADNLDDLPPC
jgi:FAD/FMN-containing dehydrogenase